MKWYLEDLYWYLEALKKYGVFNGRARRKEFWSFTLINAFISLVLSTVDIAMGNGHGELSSLYAIAVLIPHIAVSVRRLHDTGRSAWWLLIALIPCIGVIALLVFMVWDSQPSENKYGSNPKMVML
jgi:uncharacterized membrane protein YhaH (DUF805 family)